MNSTENKFKCPNCQEPLDRFDVFIETRQIWIVSEAIELYEDDVIDQIFCCSNCEKRLIDDNCSAEMHDYLYETFHDKYADRLK